MVGLEEPAPCNIDVVETERDAVTDIWHELDLLLADAEDCIEPTIGLHRPCKWWGPREHDAYQSLDVPVARSGWLEPLQPFDLVSGTDGEAGSAVARFLLGLGHTSIAYVHGTPGYRGRLERFYGLRKVPEQHREVTFRQLKFAAETRFTECLLAAHDEGFLPTAFFCAHDGLAVTVLSELLRLGYQIPQEASIVGFGDYSAATQISPQLTTVKVHGQQIGAGLVRVLDDRINARLPPEVPMRLMLAGQIIERASSGSAPAAGVRPRSLAVEPMISDPTA